ncbi:MAG: hypothetical protein IPH77_13880 [Ignavibacteria bacterium]|nr:hypothetical protein [Ignavibacteria bacterium]
MTEEFLYPGGFADEFKSFVKKLGLEINNYQILIINILFLSLVIFVVFFGNKYPLIGLWQFLVMLNGRRTKWGEAGGGKIIAMFIAAVFHLIPFLIIIFFRKNVKS